MKKYKKSVFIFRRDLRIFDNTGLNQAIRQSELVIPVFIFDPKQISKHAYQSEPGLAFLIHSIKDLQTQLKNNHGALSVFYNNPKSVIEKLIGEKSIEAIFINKDYTPFSNKRDQSISKLCNKHKVDFHAYHDLLLIEPESGLKKDGKPYTVFTPFYNNARRYPVPSPTKPIAANYLKSNLGLNPKPLFANILHNNSFTEIIKAGRHQALSILKQLDNFRDYKNTRNIPHLDNTTHLAAHNKFGTCSIREIYYSIVEQLGEDHPLIRELYWRDFFTHIATHFPHVFGNAFKKKYDAIPWNNDTKMFNAWRNGKTGFPIVDAGMRQLKLTGFMHNRVRMITASFLVKNLLIDWRKGEKHFAQLLVDYDPAVNNGNWQWAASTGCDAQPYFRIFNPWLQQEKFDPQCLYIKKWLPELSTLEPKVIHKIYKLSAAEFNYLKYPAPIVDHKSSSAQAKSVYKEAVTN